MVDDESVRVSYGSLAEGSAGIRAAYAALEAELQNLEQQLRPMLDSWSGEAREAYFVQQRKWEEASHSMAEILNHMGRAVEQAHDNYQTAENANRDLWA
jgi:early secretory antigenic target protein ESAT-6